jgi:tetratricopeptide (TPR) repeat protein
MGALLSNLGMMAEYTGDYERARELQEEGLALRRRSADKGAIAISLTNLGNVLLLLGRKEEALACQEESLALRRQTGDPWMIALGEHNLGVLTRAQGDIVATCRLFANALRVYHDQIEKWALAFMFEDTAVVAVLAGEPALALQLAGAGAALREEIGAPRGPADQAELDAQLAQARETLGTAADEAFAGGHLLELDDAVAAALGFLTPRG